MPNMRDPGHLPKLRADGRPPEPGWLPRQRRGTTPQMIGRYPDFDVLEEADSWDEATRKVVMARLAVPRELSFFSAEQAPTMRAFCDAALAQDGEPRIPVAELVDHKLAAGRLDGYQYADLPDDRETWTLVLTGLNEQAVALYGNPFADSEPQTREALLRRFAAGQLDRGAWERLNVKRAWSVCMRMVLEAFYSHPWAWNEIGFGGPAYPRGYMRLGGSGGAREPFERPGATDEDPASVAPELER
jgi:hypothetical protein